MSDPNDTESRPSNPSPSPRRKRTIAELFPQLGAPIHLVEGQIVPKNTAQGGPKQRIERPTVKGKPVDVHEKILVRDVGGPPGVIRQGPTGVRTTIGQDGSGGVTSVVSGPDRSGRDEG